MITKWSGRTAFRTLVAALLLLPPVLALTATPASATPSDLVISQVYGGGGNSGATYKNDFIELHNRGANTISLAGYSVQYAASTGSSWIGTNLTGSIPAGGYYLVQEAAGAGGTTNLPTPDASGSINMSSSAGKVALVSSTTLLSGACPSGSVVDLLGYGAGTTCSEGSVGPGLTNTTAALRNVSGCADTDNNANDFASGAPNPRNSASSPVSCQETLTYLAGANGTISGTTPQSVTYGGNGAPVTAVADPGYHFVSWSDGGLTATRTETNVQGNLSVTASFAINTYTLTYTAGANGTISGTSPQTVNYGANGTTVTAVPDAGYHFVSWSDGLLTASRTDSNVQGDISVTASFAINTYTLTYAAGANGTISGTSPQTVNHGASGSTVTAVPDAGYHFVSWSDGILTASRMDANVQADINVTATFAINQYTLTYTAGPHGTISGTTPQTVNHGADGTAVTAVPDAHYHFVSWSDGVLTATRTETNVQGNISVTATFAIDQYTLTYTAGAHGTISGTSPQTVDHGADGTAVTAVPDAGYHFVSWSDGNLTATRTDTNVQGNISVTATFAINQYTLTYTAGAHGSISGTSPQTVNHGANGTAVTAVPDAGYHFTSWSDGVLTATRTDTNVHGDISVTASFAVTSFTLTYTAGPNGSLTGTTPQVVAQGADGTAVTAVPNAGYHFTSWSDGVLTATRTETNVQADLSVTASFAINVYTLTYTAGAGGTITGTSPQTVNHGGSGTAVTAVPNANHHFVSWSDGLLTASRTDTNVQGDISVTATFAIDQHTLTYTAGAHGTISGTSPQTVDFGGSGTAVTAVPDPGYHFVTWSDAVLTATRTDANVQADLSVSASFARNQVVVSQVYGGGGNTGATYTNDYIELYNRGSDPVDLTGWTVQYASASGSTWSATALSGAIQPHKYYLVQEAAGSGGSTALPAPDATGGIAMSATAGKVALVDNATALSGTCASGIPIEDMVGYGAANCSETSPAAALTNTTAELRHGGGCIDTDDNSADLSPGTPNPRNSATAANNCTFTLVVNVDPPATGSVAKSPDLPSYTSGATVQLTATPADGYHFDHWSGGATGSATPNNVTMNDDLVITAHFLPNAFASQMVISQLYGGGGNAGSNYTNDYVELYNRGNAPANITGWTLQYASPTGTVWGTTTLIGTVPPGHYYLVEESSGGGGSTSLPAPDAIGTINLGASDGKLALVNTNVVLTGATPLSATIVDLLGYGAANFSESAPAAAMDNTTATFRGHNGCDETNNNAADFASAVPAPRNSASPANICDLWLGVGPRPAVLSLSSPRPNPSNGQSRISFGLPEDARVRLTVSDVMGRRVASLVDGEMPAGVHDVIWAGVGSGGPVRSGLYYYTLEVSGHRIVRSFVLVR